MDELQGGFWILGAKNQAADKFFWVNHKSCGMTDF